jgi:hypothetical protein
MLYLAPDLTVSCSITEHIKYGCTCYHRIFQILNPSPPPQNDAIGAVTNRYFQVTA